MSKLFKFFGLSRLRLKDQDPSFFFRTQLLKQKSNIWAFDWRIQGRNDKKKKESANLDVIILIIFGNSS